MTSPPAAQRASTVFERTVAAWNAAALRFNPPAVIVATVAILTGPLVFFRGYNSDEGLAVSIARTALEDGEWLVPHMFNLRWVERPTLLSWIIAGVSAPFGGVDQIAARLVVVAFLLLGCLLIYWLARRAAASVPAALFGVALFLACPLVIRSYVMITADLPLAVLLFLAFCMWWDAQDKAGVSFSRWLAIGVVLAFAGLLKGPQPIGYFALGVGLYILLTRSRRQLPGLILAGLICAAPMAVWYGATYTPGDEASWAVFMRVRPVTLLPGPPMAALHTVIEMLPAVIAAAVFLIGRPWRGGAVRPRFVLALACYAFVAAVAVLFWPGGSTPRYYLPMLPALCVMGALAYDGAKLRRPAIVAPLLMLSAGLLAYALIYALLSPFLPMRYRRAAIEGAEMTAVVRAAPGPIYRIGDAALNILPYVPGRIASAPAEDMAALPGPAWLVLPPDAAAALVARRPDKLHDVMPLGDNGDWRLLRLDP